MASRADSHRAEAGKRPCTKRARCADISVHFSIALPARRSNRAVRFPHHPAFLVRYTFCLSAVQHPPLCFFLVFSPGLFAKRPLFSAPQPTVSTPAHAAASCTAQQRKAENAGRGMPFKTHFGFDRECGRNRSGGSWVRRLFADDDPFFKNMTTFALYEPPKNGIFFQL